MLIGNKGDLCVDAGRNLVKYTPSDIEKRVIILYYAYTRQKQS